MMDVLSGFDGFGVPLLVFAGLVVLAILVIFIGRRARRHRGHGLVAGHRLAVIDQVQIDEHRRLVLIQRDDVQHLVILGGGSDFLVERGIGAAQSAVEEPRHAPREAAPQPVRRPAPQPAAAAPPVAEPRAPDPRAPEARAPEARPYEPPVRPSEPPARPIPAPLASRRPSAPPADEPAAVPPPVSQRAEPVIEPVSSAPSEPGPRTAVKVDPAFAGMAEELEEVLRRPAADLPPRRTPASLASAPISPAAERPVPPATPPAPPSRGPAAAEPVHTPPLAPAPAPVAPPAVAPEPRIVPARSEAAPEIRAPEVRPAEPLVEAPEAEKASDDPFEQEMANLLGRAKRP